MRHPLFLSAMIGLCMAAPAFAQVNPAERTVLQKDVEVRSGPSGNFFPTSKLYQNDKVWVLRESKEGPGAGWLEIMPPKGSFSWISARHVKNYKPGDRLAVVDPETNQPVQILVGSRLVNQQPDRESMKLTPGTIVVICDPPLNLNGETWLPILPQPTEVRYIPVSAVSPGTTVVANNNAPANWARTPDKDFVNNPLYSAAEDAIRANNIPQARSLLLQMYNTTLDPNQKQLAQSRLNMLPAQGSNLVPATTTSLSPATPASLVTTQNPTWTTYGRLRDTKLLSDSGQPLYALEDAQGKTPIYITTNPGKSLQVYIGRTVAVYGPTMYRADVRMQYVVASHVAVP